MRLSSKAIQTACAGVLVACGVCCVPTANAATDVNVGQAEAQAVLDDEGEGEEAESDPLLLISVPDDSALATNTGKCVRKQSYFKKTRTAQSVATCAEPFTLKVSSKDKKGKVSCKVGKCTKSISKSGNVTYKRSIRFTVKKGTGKGTYTVKLKGASAATETHDAGSAKATFKLIVK